MAETMSRIDSPGPQALNIRPLRESDLTVADRILRDAFDTFVGVPDLFGDKDFVRTRWLADPELALAAEVDGQLIGSNFVTAWGTVGFFGPLTVRPDRWDRGIASCLMEATVEVFERLGTRHAGLFTFSHSAKHHRLYQKFGFWPRYLTPIVVRPVTAPPAGAPQAIRYTELPAAERDRAVQACRELTATAYQSLDLEREIHAVERQGLGEVVLLDDAAGIAAMAVCHLGPGTEAGSQGCYVKFGLARPGPGARHRLETLLDACEALAASRGAQHVELGINAGRHEAYAAVIDRGYRTVLTGVAMHRGNHEGYNRPGVWLIDDWR